MKTIALLISVSLLSSCATQTKSLFLGAGIGVVAGGLVGAAVGQNGSREDQTKAIAIGAAAGAVAGGLIGSQVKPNQTKNESAGTNPLTPSLKGPEVRRLWIEDKIDASGTKYETGHWLYLIERQSTWQK